MLDPITTHALCGAAGSFVADLGKHGNCVNLPRREAGGKLYLGFIGAICIGAFVGSIVDHNPLVSGLGGYAGTKIIDYLMNQVFPELAKRKEAPSEDQTQSGEGAG